MHIVTHLSRKYEALRNAENGWSEEEGGMAQLDDDVGIVMDKLKTMGEDENTIFIFTTDNGKWPSARHEMFYLGQNTVGEGGSQAPPCKPPAKDEDSHAV
jgi:arylsulfatase